MKAGTFNAKDYMDKLHEEAEANTDQGYVVTSEKDGILIPAENKKSFDWLKNEYRKGKTEVKVEIKGEGSSFKPGYDLQTDLKSVKDFKPGMFGEIKTNDTEGGSKKQDTPASPIENKETKAEDTEPKNATEAKTDETKKVDDSPKAQQMKIDLKSKKDDKK